MKGYLSLYSLLTLLLVSTSSVAQNSCAPWSQWQTFKQHFITAQGRVIDLGSKQSITTSEGQSYALFFALIANDRDTFDNVLEWTETHLAEGDLSTRLPAWQWGINQQGQEAILDSNPASDSDLWIAYTLSQAADLWQDRRYNVLAAVMAQRIMREETAHLANLGLSLLPAPAGFEYEGNITKLNPSYVPLFILQQFSQRYPHSPWQQLHDASAKMLLATSQSGVSPDWVLYQPSKGFYYDKNTPDIGSYNAIRVYLWASMMAENAPFRNELIEQFQPMLAHVVNRTNAPLTTYAQTGKADKNGPQGFNAALLPLLAINNKNETLTALQQQMMIDTSFTTTRYYDSVLYLFGTSTLNKQFRIDEMGKLVPNWSSECR
ncbi:MULTISPECIES: cellulose synthase complex periplasmic endoglucanase BcsZ [Pseudoalteromonas]|uniref:cellulose synthase complex periplasmic endoglucanase BcsZ n=1 Tax=Pseudoalteromonas TaxID=53246 RepID=UPI0002E7CE54|nr:MULTISPECIES: cellulose synthase complex periplasmic endoglucanase BcsZ [Pseudoalteromonas]MCF6143648.1 endoglucanase [Pseudoalteromonas mariniglutinosa NCIMB 1770]TMN71392.1 cellulase [Pseudoalteromonas sp. S1727]BDF93582.1 endoglucanase [Pseudoalteromonas sp. KAN5]